MKNINLIYFTYIIFCDIMQARGGKMTENYFEAIEFARQKHEGQMRKIDKFPYIVHLYEVKEILMENNASEDEIIAGVLHDTVEDTDTTIEEIRKHFGDKIATLVDYLSEKKSMPYVERKAEHAKRLSVAPIEAKRVKCADCIANLRSIYQNIQYGIEVWSHFNSTKDNVETHYRHSIEAFKELSGTNLYNELIKYYKLVFKNK